jgi:hypothetical protein
MMDLLLSTYNNSPPRHLGASFMAPCTSPPPSSLVSALPDWVFSL